MMSQASMTPKPTVADYSLQSRLLLVFSILLFVFLGLTGFVLNSAFRNSIEAGAAERLQVQIYLLLAAADQRDGEFVFLQDPQEPRFNQLSSGLFGFINRPSLGELWRSQSARTFNLAEAELLNQPVAVGENRFSIVASAAAEEYFVLTYGILWEDGISEYNFSVVENAAPYYSEIANFRRSLWSWLGGVAALLLLMQFLLLRWGLSPLHKMAADLKEIEVGGKDQLEGLYPKELRGVTNNLNLLIETERKQQARYRTTLGDLAHSLKTPLAVISGVMQNLSSQHSAGNADAKRQQLQTVDEQIERMNQIVTYQLQRAVQTQPVSALSRQVNVAQVAQRVLDALTKVYADKAMQVESRFDAELRFYGDERDLMEVLGNVFDNAFKYGKSRLRVGAAYATAGQGLRITAEDDGPGIPENKQEFVLQRGARADTLVQGQGIGLAVVTDIVNSYKGTIRVSRSELGGARIDICFVEATAR